MYGTTIAHGLARLSLGLFALFSTAADAQTADLAVSIDDGIERVVAGATLSTYRVDVTNRGPDASLARVLIAETYPELLCIWQCTSAAGGAACPVLPQNYYVNQTHELPAGSSLVYTADCRTDWTASGTVRGTANVDAVDGGTDPAPADNRDEDVNVVDRIADLAVTTTIDPPEAVAGSSARAIVVAENLGPSRVDDVRLFGAVPTAASSCRWQCLSSSSGAPCNAGGSGALDHTMRLEPRERVTFQLGCELSGYARGTLVQTATIGSSVPDPDPANNSASDTRPLALRARYGTEVSADADRVRPGDVLNYRIFAVASGPTQLLRSHLDIRFAPHCADVQWQCRSDGAACPVAGGSGDVSLDPMASRYAMMITATCRVAASTPDGTLLLTAATLTDAEVTNLDANGTSSHGAIVGTPASIPALSPLALAALACGIALAGWRRGRARGP